MHKVFDGTNADDLNNMSPDVRAISYVLAGLMKDPEGALLFIEILKIFWAMKTINNEEGGMQAAIMLADTMGALHMIGEKAFAEEIKRSADSAAQADAMLAATLGTKH